MYHRFAKPAHLEEQCQHLIQRYHPISLTQAAAYLEESDEFPDNNVVVTVDDGYRDFFDVAFPIFSRHKIPVTVYLATDLLDEQTWLWVDQVRYLFERATKIETTIPFASRPTESVSLATPQDRKSAGWKIKESMKELPNEERHSLWKALPELLGAELPAKAPQPCAPLLWNEVRDMIPHGVDFGAHTMSHPVLARVETVGRLEKEIRGSKDRIEQETGSPCLHFCYPNGKWDDFDQRAVEAAKAGGYLTSVTAEKGLNEQGVDLFRLLRIPMEPTYPIVKFAQELAGFRYA